MPVWIREQTHGPQAVGLLLKGTHRERRREQQHLGEGVIVEDRSKAHENAVRLLAKRAELLATGPKELAAIRLGHEPGQTVAVAIADETGSNRPHAQTVGVANFQR